MTKKKYLNIPIWVWLIIAAVPVVFYSIYSFSDIIWTTKNGLTVWYCLFQDKSLGRFYATPYPLDNELQQAYYDFLIYVIFAIWDIPLFIYEKIGGVSFAKHYIALLYAKSIIIPFFILCSYKIYKIQNKLTGDSEKAVWSVFSFCFSIFAFQAVIVMGGYDVFSLFFTLSGIYAYLEHDNKKFMAYFACAIACKMFALWIFVPLVLLRWKKIWQILCRLIGGMSIIVIPKVYFWLYGIINNVNTSFIEGIDDTATNYTYIDEYMWSGEAPLTFGAFPLFFFFTFMLWVWCWFNRKDISDKMIVFISLVAMLIFVITCDTHPQWAIIVVPYIAILGCSNWDNLPIKLFLEVVYGFSAMLWQVRRRPQCFSYNIVNNMLHIEEGDREFWTTGIWGVISKTADITGIDIEHIWTLIRSILVATVLMLIFYLYPRKENGNDTFEKKEKYFTLKAVSCIVYLWIPLLGVFMRFMFK
jgi:hypothetical protein